MMTFENNREAYCVRFPDPRCNEVTVSVAPVPSGGYAHTGSGLSEDYWMKRRLGEIEASLAQASAPGLLFPDKRFIKKLLAEKKKLLRQLAAYNRKYGLSGGMLAGLDDLSDLADGPALIDSIVKGTVTVANAIKPQPKPAPAPAPYSVGGMDWQTLALYAGVVVGGVFLLKKLGKKR